MNEAAIVRYGARSHRAPSEDKFLSRLDKVHFLSGVVEAIAPLNPSSLCSSTSAV
jgi:hypothetical protein